jgi:dihydroxyacid dehydratase/phosphogluconate dehydratase
MSAKGVPGMIKDGDIIRVDGTKGTVEIIESEARNNALII